jgi:DNA invertase Pin-like site-specific DNA recombinase
LTALFDELVALKVNFVSLKDGIDLSTPAGRLIANVRASVASYETEVRAERIAAGKAAKTAKIEAIVRAGGTPPIINKGGRPKGIPNKGHAEGADQDPQDEGRAEEGGAINCDIRSQWVRKSSGVETKPNSMSAMSHPVARASRTMKSTAL